MITQTNGTQSNVAMSNLTSVVFADGEEVFPGEHSLSAPWSSQDIGAVGVPGGARQTSNSFAVRASGAGLGGSADAFHFVFQQMAGDGEIVARLAEVDPRHPRAEAALVIRQTLGPESAFAAVVVSPGAPATFQYRVSRSKPNPGLRGPKASVPQWLKLEKKDKFYIGSISEDGKNWRVVGSQTIKLSPTRNLDDQWYIGLAASSHSNGTACTTLFDEISVRLHGITFQLFTDDFKTLSSTMILPNFPKAPRSWEGPHPAAIRCTGQFIPPQTDQYSFSIRASEPCKVWVDDKLACSSAVSVRQQFSLQQLKPVTIKLETRAEKETRFAATVFWTTLSHGGGPIVEQMLLPDRNPARPQVTNASPNQVLRRAQAAAAGIVLKNGTVLAGEVKEMDETLAAFEPIGGSRQTLNTLNIARVQFRSMSPQLAARISSGSPGILLLNGDFVEGELKSFKKGRVTVSSVIFGLRSYDTANQAAALVLRPFQNGAKFVVRTSTGSALFADNIDVDQEALLLAEPILGKLRLKSNELLDIRRLSD